MQIGDMLKKYIIVIAKTENGLSAPLVFKCGTILPSYGLSNGGIVARE